MQKKVKWIKAESDKYIDNKSTDNKIKFGMTESEILQAKRRNSLDKGESEAQN